MRYLFLAFLFFYICNCRQSDHKLHVQVSPALNFSSGRSYDEIKDSIMINRKKLAVKYPTLASLNKKKVVEEISDFWIDHISNELYGKWQNTP